MKHAYFLNPFLFATRIRTQNIIYLLTMIAGMLAPLGFAPFHVPGITLLSLAFLFATLLSSSSKKQSLFQGFTFGLGYFGVGVSWVIISIHDYGQLNYFCAGIATFLFIAYLSLFPALMAYAFKLLAKNRNQFNRLLLFSTLWCVSEWLRANLFSGFPWLLVGTTQIDTPMRYLAPIIGVYGLSLLSCIAAGLLTMAIKEAYPKRSYYFIAFLLLILIPFLGKNIQWTIVKKESTSIALVQANLSMRDKWDDKLFWDLLKFYEKTIDKLLGTQLIILPESAIPLPSNYLEDYLASLNKKVSAAQSALMLGILQPTNGSEQYYYNSIITLGKATGEHIKNHLVPFGEYIPKPFVAINHWLNLPEPNIVPGTVHQPLIKVANHPIASLVCYEIAYPNLLRMQLPKAQWIVSISDNGWFGRSLASYQQLQMAQFISLLSGRFQIVVNNDGLSAVIDSKGEILDSLPPFSSGILQSEVFPAHGITPWVLFYDYPSMIFCSLFIILMLALQFNPLSKHSPIAGEDKRRYSSASPSHE